ncbi:MAG: site-specific integrase [Flexilinea sp.]|nr:site-specific integrase [Flexilinea sp.]
MKYSLQNKRGYYHAVVSYKDEDGKYRQKSISTKVPVQKGNKRRAEKTAEELVSSWLEQKKQIDAEKNNPPLSKAVELFNASKKKSVQPSTYSGYVRLGNEIMDYFGTVNLSEIDRKKIDSFFSSIRVKGTGENTVRHYCVYINSMFQFLEDEGYALSSPGLHIKTPSVRKYTGASYYNTDEVRALLTAADTSKIKLPVYIAVYLGLRRSEICGLYWDKIDLPSRTIHICRKAVQYCDPEGKQTTELSNRMKTIYSDRTLPIPNALYNVLSEIECKTGPVCRYEDGRAMSPEYVSAAFVKLLEKNGLRKIRFHDLRHTCASLLLSSGAGMKEVQVILGHASYSTTADIYSHVDITGKTRAITGLNNIIEVSE